MIKMFILRNSYQIFSSKVLLDTHLPLSVHEKNVHTHVTCG